MVSICVALLFSTLEGGTCILYKQFKICLFFFVFGTLAAVVVVVLFLWLLLFLLAVLRALEARLLIYRSYIYVYELFGYWRIHLIVCLIGWLVGWFCVHKIKQERKKKRTKSHWIKLNYVRNSKSKRLQKLNNIYT